MSPRVGDSMEGVAPGLPGTPGTGLGFDPVLRVNARAGHAPVTRLQRTAPSRHSVKAGMECPRLDPASSPRLSCASCCASRLLVSGAALSPGPVPLHESGPRGEFHRDRVRVHPDYKRSRLWLPARASAHYQHQQHASAAFPHCLHPVPADDCASSFFNRFPRDVSGRPRPGPYPPCAAPEPAPCTGRRKGRSIAST